MGTERPSALRSCWNFGVGCRIGHGTSWTHCSTTFYGRSLPSTKPPPQGPADVRSDKSHHRVPSANSALRFIKDEGALSHQQMCHEISGLQGKPRVYFGNFSVLTVLVAHPSSTSNWVSTPGLSLFYNLYTTDRPQIKTLDQDSCAKQPIFTVNSQPTFRDKMLYDLYPLYVASASEG